MELMQACGELSARSDARMQTHLSENLDEVAWVRDLHPTAASYTDVYARAGLLGPRSIFGHCIHLDDAELRLLADSGSWVAHCPTSNVALGSGRMPLERIRAAGIPVALATDVGAGPHLSMLHVMATCIDVHRGFVDVAPTEALRLATLEGARALGEADRGRLAEGAHADLVGLRIPGGLRRGEDGDSVLARVLAEFSDRWDDAVAVVVAGGVRLKG
jgi:guanine deaminase